MPEKKKLSKTREMLVNEYVKSLEQDQLPWIKEWGSKPPHNAITKTPYRLYNKVLLWYIQERNHYEDSRWCTIRQAESREWFVKKGEKSIPLEFYYYYNKRTHKSMTIEEFYPDIIVWMVFLFDGTTKIVVLLLHFKKYIILVVNHIES